MEEAAPAPVVAAAFPNYKDLQSRWVEALSSFRSQSLNAQGVDTGNGPLKYLEAVVDVVRAGKARIDIELDDVMLFPEGPSLVAEVERNTKRQLQVVSKAIDELIKAQRQGEGSIEELSRDSNRHQVYMAHRIAQVKKVMEEAEEMGVRLAYDDPHEAYPAEVSRTYEVRFVPRTASTDKPLALREIRGECLGKLVAVKAIVLRASDVRAVMQVASYTCDVCGNEILQPVPGKTFMPVSACPSPACVANGSVGRVTMLTRASRFAKYQELKVQELPEQVPVGHIPRTMTVLATGEVTRSCNAGDVIIIGGVFLPTPYTGYQAIKAGLTTDTYLEAQYIRRTKKTDNDILDKETKENIAAVLGRERVLEELSASIAPEIYGHEDVKKALLLQLVGGMDLTQKDGMKTRGDINICLMGDPGVAKSQLLKYIARSAPRAVYTTGKGSSGVGLTAAVLRDPMTQELTLEGGALVLADKGICCIDEFDKMEESDRTAIHEVMEQQTVSIAKAGITTTLNARTAILAAANPRYGRYNPNADRDPHMAMVKNINLPAALLSRFDLMFVILDKVDSEADKALAEHITHVHMHERTPDLPDGADQPHSPAFIRQYVSVAREIQTHVPKSLTPYIVEAYVSMRQTDQQRAEAKHSKSTTTPRQLLSILRLAEANARLYCREEVEKADVEEAIRLIRASKASLQHDMDGARMRPSDTDKCWAFIRDQLEAAAGFTQTMVALRNTARSAGYSDNMVQETLDLYEGQGVLNYNPSRTMVFYVNEML